jgi:hypothetical protein
MPDTDNWVEMRHPELGEDSTAPDGGLFRCSPAAVEGWKALGWTVDGESSSRGRRSASTSSTTTPEA